jgi:hypothetical protein
MLEESDTLDSRIARKNRIDTSKSAIDISESMAYGSTDFRLLECLRSLKNAFFLNFALLFSYVLVLNREGAFVPSNNESLYLLQLAKFWNPNFLSNDWTFSGPLFTHFVFNFIFGPLTLLFPLEVVGWIGRILSWSLILVGLLQLGRHFRIPLGMVTVSVLCWLFYGQSIVGGEWILGTFEGKCIAYALLLFSLNGFIQQRLIWPSILLGLAFSFHPLIGLWGALAVGLSLIVLRHPVAAIIKLGCYTALFALPGVIPLLITPLGPDSLEALRFVALVVMPYHLDPFYFASSKFLLLLLGLLLCFNWLGFRADNNNYALRFLTFFQVFLGLFFVLGIFARFTDKYELLTLMPCRLFPVLVPLFFFLNLMSSLHHWWIMKGSKRLVLVGVLILVGFGNPIALFVNLAAKHYSLWTRGEEDWEKAFKWIKHNTPINSIVISPPWRGESFYLSQRAQVASWWVPRFDRLTEWRARLESVTGDVSKVRPGTTQARLEHMVDYYNHLTVRDIDSLVAKYGARYLVSSATYNYPLIFQSGTYKVYSLNRDPLS